jgi:2-polyprenyl-3-methyl-5-hydroxy-6-metoxy-1,4-benzoquinol methylase
MVTDREKYLDLVSVQCCICNTDDAAFAGSGDDFEYKTSADNFTALKCNLCSLVYLNPRPALTEFEKIYPANYHAFDFSEKDFGVIYKVRSWLEAKRLLGWCKGLPVDARILDVGCGDGFHLSLLKKYGQQNWLPEGIDMDSRAIEMAKKSGLTVHQGTVETSGLSANKYDLAFTVQTIEHVENPPKLLLGITRLLKPGGKLIIVTDNTGSLDFSLFKKHYWGGYHFPRHWNLFNKKSISKLAEKTGLEVISVETQVSPVNWVYTIHNYLVSKNAPDWVIRRFTLKSTVSLSVFTLLDMLLQKFGRGALLRVTLKKPL